MPRNNRRKQSQAMSRDNSASLTLLRPPSFDPNTRFTQRRRFTALASGPFVITAQNLCDAFGMFCTATNASARAIAQAIKIKHIEVWGAVLTAGVTVGVEWNSTTAAPSFAPGLEVSDTSTSTAYVPHVKTRPPVNSQAAFWQSRLDNTGALNTTTVLTINNDNTSANAIGTIVDVVADVVLYDIGGSTPIPATSIATGILGSFAYRHLDGTGARNLQPVAVSFFN